MCVSLFFFSLRILLHTSLLQDVPSNLVAMSHRAVYEGTQNSQGNTDRLLLWFVRVSFTLFPASIRTNGIHFAVSYPFWVASLWSRTLCLELDGGSTLTVVSNFSTAMRDSWPQTSVHNFVFLEMSSSWKVPVDRWTVLRG